MKRPLTLLALLLSLSLAACRRVSPTPTASPTATGTASPAPPTFDAAGLHAQQTLQAAFVTLAVRGATGFALTSQAQTAEAFMPPAPVASPTLTPSPNAAGAAPGALTVSPAPRPASRQP